MFIELAHRHVNRTLAAAILIAFLLTPARAADPPPPDKFQLVQDAFKALENFKVDNVSEDATTGIKVVGGSINFNSTQNYTPGEERTATCAIFKTEAEAIAAYGKAIEAAKKRAETNKLTFKTLPVGDGEGFILVEPAMGGSKPLREMVFVQGHFRCGDMLVQSTYQAVAELRPDPTDEASTAEMRKNQKKIIDEAESIGISWLHKIDQSLVAKDCCKVSELSISLDRVKGARFSAIRLKGKGFRADHNAIITWNGNEIFRVNRLNPDGSIPGTSDGDGAPTWIWVPDDAAQNQDSEVMAVESETGRKSPAVKYTVTTVTQKQLIDNFDTIIERYLKQIPPNPKSGSGAYWNFTSWFRDDGGIYTCGWYQGRVLEFFDQLRFSANLDDRALLDGLDYAPAFSGLTRTVRVGLFGFTKPHYIDGSMPHTYVVVWPHGAALMPEYLKLGFEKPPTWENAGIAFDPWHDQKPALREIHSMFPSPTGFWAADSIYARRWKENPITYLAPTVEPRVVNSEGTKLDPPYRGLYPVTGGRYYVDSTKRQIAEKIMQFMKGEQVSSFAVHCPVQVKVTDAQGRVAEMKSDGEIANAIPGSGLAVEPLKADDLRWVGVLPDGKFTITLTGLGEGTAEVEVTGKSGGPSAYPPVKVTKGSTMTFIIDSAASSPGALKTPDGEVAAMPVKPSGDSPGGGSIASTGGGTTSGAGRNAGTGTNNTGSSGASGGSNTGTAGSTGSSEPAQAGLPQGLSVSSGLKIARWHTLKRITNFGRGAEAKFINSTKISANGAKIIFASQQGAYTINPDGSNLVRLSEKPCGLVDISNDGTRVAWYEGRDAMFVAKSDGSQKESMPGGLNVISLRLTGDGSKLFVLVPEKDGIFMLPSDGSDIKKVMATATVCKLLAIDENANHWRSLDVSDDGSELAFNLLWDLFTCNADGSELRQVTKYKSYTLSPTGYRISPDGRRVVHFQTYGQPPSMVFSNIDGSDAVSLPRPGEDVQRIWLSSDGRRAAASAGARIFDAGEKSVYDALDIGAHTVFNPYSISMTADGKRAVLQIDGPASTDQGAPSQLAVIDFNPASLNGNPMVQNISAKPRFLPNDFSTTVALTAQSAPDIAQFGAVFVRSGGRNPDMQTYFPLFDNATNGDAKAEDGTFTNSGLAVRTYSGKPFAPGPVTLRIHSKDKAGNITIADVEGVEVRQP